MLTKYLREFICLKLGRYSFASHVCGPHVMEVASSETPHSRHRSSSKQLKLAQSSCPDEKVTEVDAYEDIRNDDPSIIYVSNEIDKKTKFNVEETTVMPGKFKPFSFTSARSSIKSKISQPSASGDSKWMNENREKNVAETSKSGMDHGLYKTQDLGKLKRRRNYSETEYSDSKSPTKRNVPDKTRQWEWTEFAKKQIFSRNSKKEKEFTVMSYNVLAQNLLEENNYLYDWSQGEYLDWENRKYKLLNEIRDLHCPDVLCMQEIYAQHYEDFFLPNLTALGYEGVYLKRTGNKQDGCATFYKKDKFILEQKVPVKFYKPGKASVLDRDNVAIILKLICLQPKSSNTESVIVANTHLLYNPRRGDVKLAQLVLLLAEIDKLKQAANLSSESPISIPTILCGDFNSEPNSDMYNFIVNGFLNYEGLLVRLISGQKEGKFGRDKFLSQDFLPHHLKITDQCRYAHMEHHLHPTDKIVEQERPDLTSACSAQAISDTGSCYSVPLSDDRLSPPPSSSNIHTNNPKDRQETRSGCLWHNMRFMSVYKHTIERLKNREKEVTTHHKHGSSTVDFMFYSGSMDSDDVKEDQLKLMGRYGLLSERELNKGGGLPNRYHASDHLPILARFYLSS